MTSRIVEFTNAQGCPYQTKLHRVAGSNESPAAVEFLLSDAAGLVASAEQVVDGGCKSIVECVDCEYDDDEPGIRNRTLRIPFRHFACSSDRPIGRGSDVLTSGGDLGRAFVPFSLSDKASFHSPRRGRGTHVIDAAMATRANRLLAAGRSGAAVARELGIAKSTLNYNRQKGFIGGGAATREETAPEAADTGTGEVRDAPERRWDRSARDGRDREAPMGRGARDTTGRVLASTGALAEQVPQFAEPLFAVAGGGVLAALPMLLREGLLDRTREFLSLPKGYYGLSSVLLLLAFLFLARMRTPEALRHQAPGEWGALLGLDRCPEVKTLRRKIRALGRDPQRVRNWQNALAEAWLAEAWLAVEPEVCATLAVDGHVKVYSGRKGRLPKHFVSRQKLCLPASTSYWINALGGQPFLCLNKDLDPTMTRALEADILPALEKLGLPGPEAPDLTVSPEAEPALTLVFDREGWSPALFARLARRGIAVITWHKGFRGEPWPEADFRTVTVPIHGPAATRCCFSV